MKRVLNRIKQIPWWGWFFGFLYFGLQYGMYRLGELLSRVFGTVSYAFECKIPLIDDLIPIIPAFVIIYLFSYVFWICAPIAVSLTGKRHFTNYITGLSLAYIIGFLFFVFVPTYMDRVKENLMEVAQTPGFLYIGFGAMCGLATGLCYNSTVSTVSAWFPDMQGVASGTLLAGFGMSSFIAGKLFAAFAPADGSRLWATGLRILAILALVILALGIIVMRTPKEGEAAAAAGGPGRPQRLHRGDD